MSQSKKIEERGGVLIIFFIALLAIMIVLQTNLQEKITNANNKHVSYSDWYGSKSTKQVIKENQYDLLNTLLKSGVVTPEKSSAIKNDIYETEKLISKYEAEKTEILLGSANTPKADWTQDLDGELGKIIGLQEWEQISERYSKTLTLMNFGILFLEICIVFGVVGLIIYDNIKLQKTFTMLMLISGIVGMAIGLYGYVKTI